MAEAIRWRGRDDRGQWSDGRLIRMLHSRLQVIDLETGHQPMASHDGRYHIVFNGEIYNYTELAEQYRREGAQFRTRSDTEVILEGFRMKGAAVCNDLNGMFAFALWDSCDEALYLARDHLGKKPLYWMRHRKAIYFASTIDAFREVPGWCGELDRTAIDFYGHLGGVPAPLTVFREVRAVPPATWLRFRPLVPEPEETRYWRMDFSRKSRARFGDLMADYGALLEDAIAIRLRSDVPVALTFSGGVDSGTIAGIAARQLGRPLGCFTLDYHTDDDPSDEVLRSERIARHLGLDWQHIHYDYHRDILSELEDAYRYFDQPCQQLSLVYSYRLYREIKPHATVVLSGNGADELFTGYAGNEATRLKDIQRQWARRVPALVRAILPKRARDRMDTISSHNLSIPRQHYDYLSSGVEGIGDDDHYAEMVAAGIESELAACGVDSFLDLSMWVSLTTMTADANYRVPDVTGLAAQVEVRSPFLDYRMVEFAARLPHRFKVADPRRPETVKFLPKRYYETLVPSEVAWGRKFGMGANLRWGDSMARDPRFMVAMDQALAAVAAHDLPTDHFRAARQSFVAQKLAGVRHPSAAGTMMNGFMLGQWLRIKDGAAALTSRIPPDDERRTGAGQAGC